MELNFFRGVIAAILTPDRDHRNRIGEYIDFMRKRGITAYFILGTHGEGAKLGLEERMRFAEDVIEVVAGNGLTIIHTGAPNVGDVKRLSEHAERIGADAISIITPYYYRYDRESLINFYSKASENLETPILLYNNPPRQGYMLSIDMVEGIFSSVKQVRGIKDSSGDCEQLIELKTRFGNSHFVASGSDALVYHSFMIGLPAHVSGLACIYPEIVNKIYEESVKGNVEEALKLQAKLNKIRKVLKGIGPDTASYKHALRLRGIDLGDPLPPTRKLSQEEEKKLQTELDKLLTGDKNIENLLIA